MEKVKSLNIEKISLIIGFFVCIFCILFCIFGVNNKLVSKIKDKYKKEVVLSKNTKLYDKDKNIIGILKKELTTSLTNTKITSYTDKYLKIKNTKYYIYYGDISSKKLKKKDISNYITFNKNVKTTKKTVFYDNGKKVLELKDKVNLPLLYMDNTYYYVEFLDNILGIKKKDATTVFKTNTKEKQVDKISIIKYQKIYNPEQEECSDEKCISKEQIEEQLNYLKMKKYYTISLDEYKLWKEGNLKLKSKAVLLVTENDYNKDILKDYKFTINNIKDNKEIGFDYNNNPSTKDSKIELLPSYLMTNTTKLIDFGKMIRNEILENTSSSNNDIGVAVLNYHFFYDKETEACTESICLDIKDFKEQLDYLIDNNFKILTIEEFKDWMYNRIDIPEKSVLITIDDGAFGTSKINGNKLIPILEEKKIPATLFLITSWWDKENYLSEYLTIESHGDNLHEEGDCGNSKMLCLEKEEVLNDLNLSIEKLNSKIAFTYPFYSYNTDTMKIVEEAGFSLAFVGGGRKAYKSDNKYMLPRYVIQKDTSLNTFINIVN